MPELAQLLPGSDDGGGSEDGEGAAGGDGGEGGPGGAEGGLPAKLSRAHGCQGVGLADRPSPPQQYTIPPTHPPNLAPRPRAARAGPHPADSRPKRRRTSNWRRSAPAGGGAPGGARPQRGGDDATEVPLITARALSGRLVAMHACDICLISYEHLRT